VNIGVTASSEPKALRLARFLKEFVGLRSTTVYDLKKYESVLWFGDMPQERECRSPAWNNEFEAGDPWLVVHKQQFPKPPALPEIILPWINDQALGRATAEIPALRPTIMEPDVGAEIGDGEEPPLTERHLIDFPEVVEAYDRYRPNWEGWSQEYQRRSLIQSVYAELFRLHTQVQKQGEIIELVLGFGLLAWRAPSKGNFPPILRHIATARVDLHFDASNGTIRLDGAADGAQLKIEDDMLDAELRPDRAYYASVGEQLNHVGDNVWDRPSMFTALRSWAAALHADSEWSSDLSIAASVENRPTVSFAPALIMRKRSQVGMVRIYDALINQLSRQTEEVPPGWMGLVHDDDDQDVSDPALPPGETATAPYLGSQDIFSAAR
jgi:hypothetical protein